VSDNEKDDEAEVRRKRLQALRNKQSQNSGDSSAGAAGGLARKIKGRKNADAGETEDAGDRKRQLIKKLIKKRMQEGGGGEGAVSKKSARKGAIGEILKKKSGNAGASGADLSKFPKLKAMIEQRRAKESGSAPAPVEKLEHRVKKLEDEVRKTQDQIKSSKQFAAAEDQGDAKANKDKDS